LRLGLTHQAAAPQCRRQPFAHLVDDASAGALIKNPSPPIASIAAPILSATSSGLPIRFSPLS